MVNYGSTRNLLVFGGLAVFALGWGGGILLGVLRPPAAMTPHSAPPQVVDADEYAPETETPPVRKSSSLLEQVFGLDDLEEEKPARPETSPEPVRRAPDEGAPAAAQGLPADGVGESQNEGTTVGNSVVLEEVAPAPQNALDAPEEMGDAGPTFPPEGETPAASDANAPAVSSSKKDILGENPYK